MINGSMSTQALGVSGQWELLKLFSLLFGWISLAALWRVNLREIRWEKGDQLYWECSCLGERCQSLNDSFSEGEERTHWRNVEEVCLAAPVNE